MKFHSDMTFLKLSFPRPTYISVSTPIVSDLISVKYIIPLRIHGYRIILAETYVEEPRFKGTCYLAANWMRVGRTVRRSGKARKTVLLRELVPNCRDILCGRKPCPGNRK